MKKRIKEFFTLTRRSNGGFTLVELIVVIAILAILGGVAIPVYSGYVKKANMQADISLAAEVADALTLYYYSNPGVDSFYVVLNQEGTDAEVSENAEAAAAANAAMEAVFGADWQKSVGLKYADWEGVTTSANYKDSSYFGKESSLINTVDGLTDALGKWAADNNNADDLFVSNSEYLVGLGVDKTNGKAVANAAVLYVAEQTKSNSAAIEAAFAEGLSATAGNPVDNVFNALVNAEVEPLVAAAAIYAYAEGYAQNTNQAEKFHNSTDFSNVTDAASAISALGTALGSLDGAKLGEYASGQGQKDLAGYIDMMGIVEEKQDSVSGNLNSADCFTDGKVEGMLKDHAAMSSVNIATEDGQIAVVLMVADNAPSAHMIPLNWD